MRRITTAIITMVTVLTMLMPVVHAKQVKMTLTYDGKAHPYSAESIDLYVKGNKIDLPVMPPVLLGGRTFVPSREVFEPLGAIVDWKAASQEVYISYNQSLVILKPNLQTANLNGTNVKLDAPAKMINGKLMIPVRFVAENIGVPVEWDGYKRIVYVGEKDVTIDQNTVDEGPYTPIESSTPVVPSAPVVSQPQAQAPISNGTSIDMSPTTLSIQQGGPINVTNVTCSGNIFTVSANGAISKVEKQLLPENKLVLDIYNATNFLSQKSYTFPGYSGITSVRNSQFSESPEKITRVVFDLYGANKFTVQFSADRKSIVVAFEENNVQNLTFQKQGVSDLFTITSAIAPTITDQRMYSPDRLVFDVKSAKNSIPFAELPVDGNTVSSVKVSQLDESTVCIVMDLKSPDVNYTVTNTANTAVISVSPPTYKNIRYAQSTFTLTNAGAVDVSQIATYDDYLNNKYTVTLPGDFSGNFGYGAFNINDGLLSSVTIQNNAGRTELVFNEKSIYAYVISKQGDNVVIRVVNPKEVYKTVVYVDAGHGANDPGASGGGLTEKNVNLDIMLKLYNLLEQDPAIKVYASRLSDTYPDNTSRATIANHCADLFVSIHQNSAGNASAKGTEVLYNNHAGEVYPAISSEAVARIFQTNLVAATAAADRGVVKRPDLIVLNTTKIPAVLVECGFLSNETDAQRVSNDEGRQIIANALYKSVKDVFTEYPTGR